MLTDIIEWAWSHTRDILKFGDMRVKSVSRNAQLSTITICYLTFKKELNNIRLIEGNEYG